MKKILLIAVGFMVAVFVFGMAGFAYAQSQTPPTPEYPYGPGMHAMRGVEGMPGGYGRGYGHGMMGGYGMHGDWDGEYGPMHEAMIAALAEALGLTPEELEARHDAGETMWQIAESEGLSAEEIQEFMLSAHDTALEDAVANGQLAEDQAEWMDAHMEQMWSGEYGNGGFGGHCGGGGWNASRWQGEN
jgi:CO/xanthine dehydrogenase Mo-binding subunit